MTRTIALAHHVDIPGWRKAAREAIREKIEPSALVWTVGRAPGDLLASRHIPKDSASFPVPRRFVALADSVLLHRDPVRFDVMYRILWRLQECPKALDDESDPDIRRASLMAKAVGRDIHKMHAFVRFKEVETDEGHAFLAWFEPEHHIVLAGAQHFVRRFASMRWAILTPQQSVAWDGEALHLGPGATRAAVPAADRFDDHWRAYYRSIFNPARLKISAMTKEMPKKYWRNLPEATEIAGLIRGAVQRTVTMIDAPASLPSPMTAVEERRRGIIVESAIPPRSLEALRKSAETCERCPLAAGATQTVFGEGPVNAAMMIVGEQPGDQEDLAGKPFVGPAGQLLDRALDIAQIRRADVYVTNAVKHFKYEPRGKRRIHSTPNAHEVAHCRRWLDQERLLIKPRLIIALGATAARSVLNRAVRVGQERGRAIALPDGSHVWVTVHPSYILRLPKGRAQADEMEQFIAELSGAYRWLLSRAA